MSARQRCRVISNRTSITFRNLFFPVDVEEWIEVLAGLGFQPVARIPPPQSPGVKIEAVGEIATREGVVADINPDKKVFGLTARSGIKEMLVLLDEIQDALSRNLVFDSQKNARYYEAVGNYHIISNKSAIQRMAEIAKGSTVIESISKICGRDLSMFMLRAGSGQNGPDDEEWFEVQMAPRRERVDRVYQISLIFRSPDRGKFSETVQRLEEMATNMAAVLDGIKQQKIHSLR